jgi:uncharacterized protein
MSNIKKKVYIVHGYQASTLDHWFPWLSRKVKAAGHDAKRIMLDQPLHPDPERWQSSLKAQLSQLDEHSIIVTHNLSCLSVLQFLQQQYNEHQTPICAGIFVAGFKDPIVALSELNRFVRATKLQFKTLNSSMKQSVVFFSSNDPYVPAPLSLQLGQLLNAQIYEVRNAGHFMKRDGYETFEQLWQVIQQCLSSDVPKMTASL